MVAPMASNVINDNEFVFRIVFISAPLVFALAFLPKHLFK
jgi:hypothetical protein